MDCGQPRGAMGSITETDSGLLVVERAPRKAFLDVDNTLTDGMVLFDCIRSQADAELINNPDAVLQETNEIERQMASGSYENPLFRFLCLQARALEGHSVSEILTHDEEFYRQPHILLPYVRPMVETLRNEYEYESVLASGGSYFGVWALANILAIRKFFGTLYGTEINGSGEEVFSGELISDLASGEKKGEVVEGAIEHLPVEDRECCIMLGDSVGDMDAMQLVGGAFLVNPSPVLKAAEQDVNGIEIPKKELWDDKIPPTMVRWLGARGISKSS